MSSLFPFVGEMMPSHPSDGFPRHPEVVIVHAIGPDGVTVEQANGVVALWQLGYRWRVRRLDTPVSEFKRVPYFASSLQDQPPKAPPIPVTRVR